MAVCGLVPLAMPARPIYQECMLCYMLPFSKVALTTVSGARVNV